MIRFFDLPKKFWTDPKRAWSCRKAMKEFVKEHPICDTCGRGRTATQPIVAHHVLPFHLYPELADDPTNFTAHHHPKCHFHDGHAGQDWKHWVENVREICAIRRVHEEIAD